MSAAKGESQPAREVGPDATTAPQAGTAGEGVADARATVTPARAPAGTEAPGPEDEADVQERIARAIRQFSLRG